MVKVSLADMAPIKPENVEAGTGFYGKRYVGPEIKPDFGKVTVTKVDEGKLVGGVVLVIFVMTTTRNLIVGRSSSSAWS